MPWLPPTPTLRNPCLTVHTADGAARHGPETSTLHEEILLNSHNLQHPLLLPDGLALFEAADSKLSGRRSACRSSLHCERPDRNACTTSHDALEVWALDCVLCCLLSLVVHEAIT